jgi:S-formylglutathione hydrolase FrmB
MRSQTIRARIVLVAIFFCLTLTAHAQSASVETVQFQSKLTNATLPYNVILPPDYRASKATRYPVLVLYHGLDGHYTDWLTRTNVADYAAQYPMIVVMPEGKNGWYTDSASNVLDRYGLYVLMDLMPDVQGRYRTIESRYGRGIAGLSMGGYGAIKFGLKRPAVFAFVGSMSGALAAATWTEDDLKNFKSIRESVFSVFGPVGSETRKANDIYEITRGLSAARVAGLPYIYLDCGTEDSLMSGANQQFAALLREKKIPHEYRELPGDHKWAYWDQQVPEVLRIAAQKLRMPRAMSREIKRPPRRK